jgi:hypothetical protein
MASRYAGIRPTLLERIGLRLTLLFLNRFNRKDVSSQEFACFGYHVLAQKDVSV